MSRNQFCATAFGRGTALVLCLFAAPSFADTVTDWNETAIATIAAEKTNPPLASRNMALVQAAVFEAVNSITGSYTPYEQQPSPRGASPEAAAMTAAYRVLLALYPDRHTELDTAYAQALQKVSSGTSKSDGITVGETAAAALLQRRSTDGAETITVYDAPSGPGVWEPSAGATPLVPGWGKVAPWFLQNGSQFRPAGPPKLNSDQFSRDFKEVKQIGGKTSTIRTPEQTDIARFWTSSGVVMWNPIARQLSVAKRLTLAENAALFALLNMATADALIACYDAKYTYKFWRPTAAIRAGAAGDSPDPDWESAVPLPPFPAYVSGHACYAGAAQAVLESVFGTGQIGPVTLTSAGAPGVVHRYSHISDIVGEISNARVWGGIHWRTDEVEGEALGRNVGAYALKRFPGPITLGDAK